MALLNNDWIFPKEFIEDDNSTRLLIHEGNNITIAKEYLYRSKTVWFMKDLSNIMRKTCRAKKEDDPDYDIRVLKVFWTAAIFFHRFFLFHSFHHDRFDVAVACLFLAGKVEEKFLRLRDHVAMCIYLRKREFPSDEERREKEKSVLQAERILLNTLNFDLNITHPFSFFKNIIGKELKPYFADSDASKRVLRLATTLATDSMESTLCLLYTPKQLAYGLVFMAITLLSLQPTTNSNSNTNYNIINSNNWLDIFEKDIDDDILKDICFRLIDTFENKTTIDEVIINNDSNTYKTNINNNIHKMKNNRVSRTSSQTGFTDSPASSQSLSLADNSNNPNEESKSNTIIDNKLSGLKRKDLDNDNSDDAAKQMRIAAPDVTSTTFPTNTDSDATPAQPLASDDAPPPPPLPLQPSSQPYSLPLQATGQLYANDTPFSVNNTPSFDSVARPGSMVFPS